TPATLPQKLPATWMQAKASATAVQFIESRFDQQRTSAEIRQGFGEPRNIEFTPMSLRSIFLAMARTGHGLEEGGQDYERPDHSYVLQGWAPSLDRDSALPGSFSGVLLERSAPVEELLSRCPLNGHSPCVAPDLVFLHSAYGSGRVSGGRPAVLGHAALPVE